MWNAADKVGRAVKRVDKPAIFSVLIAGQPGFLTLYRMLWVGLLQLIDQILFRLDIDFRHEIVDALGFDHQLVEIVRRPDDIFTDLPGGAQRNIDHRFHLDVLPLLSRRAF